jgi:hypothetical protein
MSTKLNVGKWGKPRDSRQEPGAMAKENEPVKWTPVTQGRLDVGGWHESRNSLTEASQAAQALQARNLPRIVVSLTGGIGNQLFQYAFGISIAAARHNLVGFTLWRCSADKWRPAGYQLDAFAADVHLLPQGAEGTLFFSDNENFAFQSAASAAPVSTFIGYWQTEKYFNIGLVREKVAFRYPLGDQSLRVAEAIAKAGKTSTFLHIRQGADYLRKEAEGYHGVLSMDYYNEAIKQIREAYEGVRFFVFGDNPGWMHKNFSGEGFTIVNHIQPDTDNVHEDMHLMSLCQNGAISNSSFSWWAAWLGEQGKSNQLIFAPQRWLENKNVAPVNTSDVVPDRWIKLGAV